jgi:DNA-binding response OmpR family regulator
MPKIVIMEDSQMLRAQWKRLLSREGLEVVEALTSNQLFAVLLEKEVDLIVLDLFMGGEHGFHIIKRVKQDPSYANIPIMVATIEQRRESIQEVIDEGINDYLIKPFDVEFFIRRIKRLLIDELSA